MAYSALIFVTPCYCIFLVLKMSLLNCNVFFSISAVILPQSLLKNTFLTQVILFEWLNKLNITVTLPKTINSFYLVTGMPFLAQNNLISYMRGLFDPFLTDYRSTANL